METPKFGRKSGLPSSRQGKARVDARRLLMGAQRAQWAARVGVQQIPVPIAVPFGSGSTCANRVEGSSQESADSQARNGETARGVATDSQGLDVSYGEHYFLPLTTPCPSPPDSDEENDQPVASGWGREYEQTVSDYVESSSDESETDSPCSSSEESSGEGSSDEEVDRTAPSDDEDPIEWELDLIIENVEGVGDEEDDAVESVLESVRRQDVGSEFLMLARKHKLTYSATNAILEFISVNHRKLRQLPNSYKKLKRKVNGAPLAKTITFQCESCEKVWRYKYHEGFLKNASCCGVGFSYNMGHYVTFDVAQVLQLHLPSVCDIRQQEFISPLTLRQFTELGLNPAEDLSLTLNLDGVSYSKNGVRSIWPLLGYIDGIPAHMIKGNVVMFGVWLSPCGSSKKPNFDIFLRPLIAQFKTLLEDGLAWHTFPCTTTRRSRLFISRVLCDSMARPAVQYMQQFNGKYGCSYCYHKQSGHYYRTTQALAPIRTDLQHRQVCLSSHRQFLTKSHLKGIKGVSPFLELTYFDMITGFPPDIMHGVYLGVTKNLTMSWMCTSSRYHLSRDEILQINKRLGFIKPPKRVTRDLDSIQDCGQWKAHQWSLWLLYYSPIVLKDILERMRYDHWMRFVFAISILVKPRLFDDDLNAASALLENVSSETPGLYGKQKCTFNLHLLRHLVVFCRHYGPLHTFSMTPFESFNIYFKGSITDSQGVGLQTCDRFVEELKISLRRKLEAASCGERKLLWSILQPTVACEECCDEGVKKYYAKCKLANGRIYYSSSYTALKKRDSTFMICTDYNSIAHVLYFYVCSEHHENVYAAVKRYKIRVWNNDVDHIWVPTLEPVVDVSVGVEFLMETVLHVLGDNNETYFCTFQNSVEHVCE